jgi:hypothetical protein
MVRYETFWRPLAGLLASPSSASKHLLFGLNIDLERPTRRTDANAVRTAVLSTTAENPSVEGGGIDCPIAVNRRYNR